MEDMDMRNMILSDIIDKMHSRMADKMFPPDPSLDDKPAVTGITMDGTTAEGKDIPAEMPHAEDLVGESQDVDNEPTDEELDEMLKS